MRVAALRAALVGVALGGVVVALAALYGAPVAVAASGLSVAGAVAFACLLGALGEALAEARRDRHEVALAATFALCGLLGALAPLQAAFVGGVVAEGPDRGLASVERLLDTGEALLWLGIAGLVLGGTVTAVMGQRLARSPVEKALAQVGSAGSLYWGALALGGLVLCCAAPLLPLALGLLMRVCVWAERIERWLVDRGRGADPALAEGRAELERRLDARELDRPGLELLLYAQHPPALGLGRSAPIPRDLDEWVKGLERFGQVAAVRAAAAAVRFVVPPEDPADVRAAWAAGTRTLEEWVACPCARHAALAERALAQVEAASARPAELQALGDALRAASRLGRWGAISAARDARQAALWVVQALADEPAVRAGLEQTLVDWVLAGGPRVVTDSIKLDLVPEAEPPPMGATGPAAGRETLPSPAPPGSPGPPGAVAGPRPPSTERGAAPPARSEPPALEQPSGPPDAGAKP